VSNPSLVEGKVRVLTVGSSGNRRPKRAAVTSGQLSANLRRAETVLKHKAGATAGKESMCCRFESDRPQRLHRLSGLSSTAEQCLWPTLRRPGFSNQSRLPDRSPSLKRRRLRVRVPSASFQHGAVAQLAERQKTSVQSFVGFVFDQRPDCRSGLHG
jgi:hypothetical protein